MNKIATMSSKGQLVIPAKLRKELGWKPGVRVFLKRDGETLLVTRGNAEIIEALCGKYAGYPLEQDLAQARRLDEEKMEAR